GRSRAAPVLVVGGEDPAGLQDARDLGEGRLVLHPVQGLCAGHEVGAGVVQAGPLCARAPNSIFGARRATRSISALTSIPITRCACADQGMVESPVPAPRSTTSSGGTKGTTESRRSISSRGGLGRSAA